MKKYLLCLFFLFNKCVGIFAESITDLYNKLFQIINKKDEINNCTLPEIGKIAEDNLQNLSSTNSSTYLSKQTFITVVLFNMIIDGDIIHQSTTNEYCEEGSTYVGNRKLTWKKTHVGSSAYPNELCFDKNGIIPHRDCIASDNSSPGIWLEVTGNCSNNLQSSNLTNTLHQMMITYALHHKWDFELLFQISTRIDEFVCVDLYLLSKALYYMTIEEYLPVLLDYFGRTMDNVLDIYSKLNEQCVNSNAATYILGAMNVFFNSITEQPNDLKKIIGRNFIFQITNPFFDGIVGLGLYRNEGNFFGNSTIRPILSGESYEDISLENLELAGYVPDDVITKLTVTLSKEAKEELRIIITAFRNSNLLDLGNDSSIVSSVIGFTISKFCSRQNDILFDIYLKPLLKDNDGQYGEWFTINNNYMYSNNVVEDCVYTPVTYMCLYNKMSENESCRDTEKYPYAKITIQETESPNRSIDFHDENPVFDILSSLSVSINYAQPQTVIQALYKKHQEVLRALTLIGCILSMVGLLATVLTLLFIKQWYEKRMYTLHLKIAMAFQTFLFLIDSDISYITYIVLYYFILAQFSWMMLIGYTQYLKFVKVFNDNSLNTLKALMIGWLLPALVILIPIALYPNCLYCEFCREKREILVYFVIIPTSLIILININLYLLIMMNVCKSKAKIYGGDVSKRQIRVGILLPFMLGITWIFVFALVSPWRWFSLTGSYLFHVIAPMQVFVLFIFVVVLDKNTRIAWKTRYLSVMDNFNAKNKMMMNSRDERR